MNEDEFRSHRLVDTHIVDDFPVVDESKNRRLSLSITGYANEPLVTLEEACQPLESIINELPVYVSKAKDASCSPVDNLSEDESASIYLYTMEWSPSEKSLYVILNRTLRDSDRSELTIKPWFKYLKLFLTALAKLPSLSTDNRPQIVYRGLKMSVDDTLYRTGSFVTWWSFSSCTQSLSVLQSDKFLGTKDDRTIFNIETIRGKNICSHSRFHKEDEVLLIPGTYMEVVSRADPAPKLRIIHLREKVSSECAIDLPFEGAFFIEKAIRRTIIPWYKKKRYIFTILFFTIVAIIIPSVLSTRHQNSTGVATTTTTLPPQTDGNSTAVCYFFGDPHLLAYPLIPYDTRSHYWCQISSEQLLLKNDYVQLKVNFTESFWNIKQFQILLYKTSGEMSCTLTDQYNMCNDSNIIVSVLNNGTWIDIIYRNTSMRIQIRQHLITLYYDISIYLNFKLIYLSEGLCIDPSEYCTLESVGATSRHIELVTKRDISISNNAVEICNLYLNGAINATKILNITYQSGMIYNLNISCLNDVNITNDLTAGTSSLYVLLAEGINSLNLNDTQFQIIVNQSVSVVNEILQTINNYIMQSTSTTSIGSNTLTTNTITASTRITTTINSTATITTTITTITTTAAAINTTILPIISPNATWSNTSVVVAGGNGRGNASNQLGYPCGFYVDVDQTIYIADRLNSRIMAWTSGATNGQVVAGINGQGNRNDQLDEPTDVYLDKQTNNLIICDWGNRRVIQWSLQNGTINGTTIISNIDCYGVIMDDQRFIYISDIVKNEVRQYQMGDTNGTLIGGGNAQVNPLNNLSYPSNLFIDRNYSVYVSDNNNNRVMKWVKGATDGIVVAGGQGRGSALIQLNHPFGVYVDQLGTLYVSDSFNNRTMRWPNGATQGTVIIDGTNRVSLNEQLGDPRSLSFDQYGNLYIVDWNNDRVLRYDIINN